MRGILNGRGLFAGAKELIIARDRTLQPAGGLYSIRLRDKILFHGFGDHGRHLGLQLERTRLFNMV